MSEKLEPVFTELDGGVSNDELRGRYLELQELRRLVRIAECCRANLAIPLEVIHERRAARTSTLAPEQTCLAPSA